MQEDSNQTLGVKAGTGATTGAGLDGGSNRGTGGGTNASTDSQIGEDSKPGHPLVKVETESPSHNKEQNQEADQQSIGQQIYDSVSSNHYNTFSKATGSNVNNAVRDNDSYGEGSGRSFGYESVGGSEVSDLMGETGANTGFTKVDSSDANRRVENAEQSKESQEKRNG